MGSPVFTLDVLLCLNGRKEKKTGANCKLEVAMRKQLREK